MYPSIHLPLRLLPVQEALQNSHLLLQRSQPDSQLSSNLGRVVTQLDIEVLSVRACRHSGAEDGLNHEAVVGLESRAISISEGGG